MRTAIGSFHFSPQDSFHGGWAMIFGKRPHKETAAEVTLCVASRDNPILTHMAMTPDEARELAGKLVSIANETERLG